MQNYYLEVGKRLREVRSIFNEGTKLSGEQFAYLLEETGDRIRNYELGRATVPVRLLFALYNRGINPIYIIAGEGSIFADNKEGKKFKKIVEERSTFDKVDSFILKAAAGRLEQ
ncbi:MAG: hypothetical protein NTW25_08885 [Candidatus Kapabacteria bacterium]|nr:hypothetical protein [Candidatus Kapabacteria bacterium]